MKASSLSERDVATVRQAYRNDAKTRHLCETYGVSKDTIRRAVTDRDSTPLAREGVRRDLRDALSGWTAADDANLREAYDRVTNTTAAMRQKWGPLGCWRLAL